MLSTNCRRDFLKTTLAGGMAALIANRLVRSVQAAAPVSPPPAATDGRPKVALTTGNQRTDNIVRAMKSMEKDIAEAIGKRRVVIKPNLVTANVALACSHADAITGILDFLKGIGKLDNTIIAESSASNTQQGFQFNGYQKLADTYKVKLVDLDQQPFQTVMAISQNDAKPHPVRVSSLMANQNENFIISACMLKTHDRAVCTMGIKNVIVGAGIKFPRGGNDKQILHGDGPFGININLAMLSPILHPSLTVIDGFEGMEGNGPSNGSKVDHRVCVVSADYVAADAVGATLMGIGADNVGYVTYLGNAGVGESDVTKMDIIGEPIAKLAKKYRLSNSSQTQLMWKQPARVG